MEGETLPIETRLQQAMPDMLMRVDGVRESLQADIQVVGDRVEQSLETANSIVHHSGISFLVEFHSL